MACTPMQITRSAALHDDIKPAAFKNKQNSQKYNHQIKTTIMYLSVSTTKSPDAATANTIIVTN